MMIDPREFRRTYPTFQVVLSLLCIFQALSGREELAVCLAVCGCATELVRGGWSALMEPVPALFRCLSLAAVMAASVFLLASTIQAIQGDFQSAILALVAAVLLRGMGPVRVSAGSARA